MIAAIDYFPGTVAVGGVTVPVGHLGEALACLRRSPGLMVRQPLARIGSPLALCDFHAVAEPYRYLYLVQAIHGRGAAGRPITKLAFCAALVQLETDTSTQTGMVRLHADAMEAFCADPAYATAMAGAAVALAARAHRGALASQLRQAAHQAVSACEARQGEFHCPVATACGTGGCRFAAAGTPLVRLTAPARPGKMRRPANHAAAGQTFDPFSGLAELEERSPFVVPIPIRDTDAASFRDAVKLT